MRRAPLRTLAVAILVLVGTLTAPRPADAAVIWAGSCALTFNNTSFSPALVPVPRQTSIHLGGAGPCVIGPSVTVGHLEVDVSSFATGMGCAVGYSTGLSRIWFDDITVPSVSQIGTILINNGGVFTLFLEKGTQLLAVGEFVQSPLPFPQPAACLAGQQQPSTSLIGPLVIEDPDLSQVG